MAWHIGSLVRSGEIMNTRRNTVQGWLHLRGSRHPVLLQLTGNCGDNLTGRHLRFRAAESRGAVNEVRRRRLQRQQIGPTGRMQLTLAVNSDGRQVILLLEWYSQNGRMVLELCNPYVEFVERPQWDALTVNLLAESSGLAGGAAGESASTSRGQSCCGDIPMTYDGAPSNWETTNQMMRGTANVPLCVLFDPPLKLPTAEQLGEAELQRTLRRVLARLARHGIAIDVCEHFTERDTYRILLEQILPTEDTFAHLPQLGYVQHYMLHKYCPRCDTSDR